jgi:transposase
MAEGESGGTSGARKEPLPRLPATGLRRWPVSVKRRIVEETFIPGSSVSIVARRYDVNTNQVFTWRQQYRRGELGKPAVLPVAPGHDLIRVGVIDHDGGLRPTPGISQASASSPLAPHPQEAAVPENPCAAGAGIIEIELKSGIKVRVDAGIGEAALRRILVVAGSLA